MNLYYVLGVLVFLVGCEARPESVAEQHGNTSGDASIHHPKAIHVKPGADIHLLDPAPRSVEPGLASAIELMLSSAYDQGVLRVEISADQELELLSPPSVLEFVITPGANYTIPLQVMAKTPGRFYIRLLVNVETGSQSSGRSLAVAVQASEPVQSLLKQEKMTYSSATGSEQVISLPAQETISPAE